MRSAPSQEAYDLLKPVAAKIKATNTLLNRTVIVSCEDDFTNLIIQNAFVVDINEEYFGVVGEHYREEVFSKNEYYYLELERVWETTTLDRVLDYQQDKK